MTSPRHSVWGASWALILAAGYAAGPSAGAQRPGTPRAPALARVALRTVALPRRARFVAWRSDDAFLVAAPGGRAWWGSTVSWTVVPVRGVVPTLNAIWCNGARAHAATMGHLARLIYGPPPPSLAPPGAQVEDVVDLGMRGGKRLLGWIVRSPQARDQSAEDLIVLTHGRHGRPVVLGAVPRRDPKRPAITGLSAVPGGRQISFVMTGSLWLAPIPVGFAGARLAAGGSPHGKARLGAR